MTLKRLAARGWRPVYYPQEEKWMIWPTGSHLSPFSWDMYENPETALLAVQNNTTTEKQP